MLLNEGFLIIISIFWLNEFKFILKSINHYFARRFKSLFQCVIRRSYRLYHLGHELSGLPCFILFMLSCLNLLHASWLHACLEMWNTLETRKWHGIFQFEIWCNLLWMKSRGPRGESHFFFIDNSMVYSAVFQVIRFRSFSLFERANYPLRALLNYNLCLRDDYDSLRTFVQIQDLLTNIMMSWINLRLIKILSI